MFKPRRWALIALLAAVSAVYAAHFDNGFHFDDSHTIVENPAIRDLHQWRRLLTDGRAFSVLPSNQGWRPLVTLSLAFDYWLAGGLNPPAFHADVFLAFLLLLVLFFRLASRVLEPRWGLVATALFGLHPIAAETINYLIQRADLYVALGCCLSLLWYSEGRRVWLLGFMGAALSKPTALIFPALLWLWMATVEGRVRRAPLLGSLACAGVFAALHASLTPDTFRGGGVVAWRYWLTQPYVLCLQVGTFFWPTGLVADTDLAAFTSWRDPRAGLGLLGLAVLLGALVVCRRTGLRPLTLGLGWFLLASLPTSLTPLAEVTNDHRLFFPAMGLALATAYAVSLLPWRRATAVFLLLWLAWLSACTVERNRVWDSEASLWHDVTLKSPKNGRGWMNYGVSQMAIGHFPEAERSFRRAVELYPNYPLTHVNLGICLYATGRPTEGEAAFSRAEQLDPNLFDLYFHRGQSRIAARQRLSGEGDLRRALELRPQAVSALRALLQSERQHEDWRALQETAESHADLLASAPELRGWLEGAQLQFETTLARARSAARETPDGDHYAELSFRLWQAGRDAESAAAALQGLQNAPRDARLYNNLAAARLGQKRWTEAAEAAREALRLQPEFPLARNNLRYAEKMATTEHRR